MLYEPTNIIPSAGTQTGTIAAADNVNVQWQVNGDSALSAFQIDVLTDSAESKLVYSTGVINSYLVSGSNVLPFYGKDRLGNAVAFTYAPNNTWAGFGIQDGSKYKYYITQFYKTVNTIFKVAVSSTLSSDTVYYFTAEQGGQTYYISFIFPQSFDDFWANGDSGAVYYDFTNACGWLYNANERRFYADITFSCTTQQPSGTSLGAGNQLSANAGDLFYNIGFTQQIAASAIIARTLPELSINEVKSPLINTVNTFTATYSQAQGDVVASVRWQLYQQQPSGAYAIIEDTGTLYTPILEFYYSGFMSGNNYYLTCDVTTQNNIEVTAQPLEFSVQFAENSYDGNFDSYCLTDEYCNYLEWDGLINMPATVTPQNGYSISESYITLNEGTQIIWDKVVDVETEAINFASPWTVLWAGKSQALNCSYQYNIETVGEPLGTVHAIATSHDGKLLLIANNESSDVPDKIAVFSVSGANTTYLYDITFDERIEYESGKIFGMEFSPEDKFLAVYGANNIGLQLFKVNGTEITFFSVLQESYCKFATFSPKNGLKNTINLFYYGYSLSGSESNVRYVNIQNDIVYDDNIRLSFPHHPEFWVDRLLFIGDDDNEIICCGRWGDLGDEEDGIVAAHVAWGRITSPNDEKIMPSITLEYEAPQISQSALLQTMWLSPNGQTLIVGYGQFPYTGVYRMLPDYVRIDYMGLLPSNNFMIGIDTEYQAVAFSPNSKYFVCWSHGQPNKLYSVSEDGGVSYVKTIPAPNQKNLYSDTMLFSNSGAQLFAGVSPVGGAITSTAAVYDAQGMPYIYYLNDINRVARFANGVSAAAISGQLVVLCGGNGGQVSKYSLESTDIAANYISNITINSSYSNVNSAIFNPTGSLLVLAGDFENGGIVSFSVNGTDVGNSVAVTSPLSSGDVFNCGAFNAQGTLYVAGSQAGSIYLFTVNGTTVTYKETIQVNGTTLSGAVNTVSFSPDGSLLAIGGEFNNYAYLFTVNGTTVTYKETIQVNGTTLSGEVNTVSFSPDGSLLVIGGEFNNYAYLFTVNGTTVTYKETIQVNGEPLNNLVSCVKFISDSIFLLCTNIQYAGQLFSVNNNSHATYTGAFILPQSDAQVNVKDALIWENATSNADYIILAGQLLSGAGVWSVGNVEKQSAQASTLFFVESNNISVQIDRNSLEVANGSSLLATLDIPATAGGSATDIVVELNPTALTVYAFRNNTFISSRFAAVEYTQENLTALSMYGKQVCDYISVIDGDGDGLSTNLSNYDFTPLWNNTAYKVLMLADFNENIDGGTATILGNGFRIYKQDSGKSTETAVVTLPATYGKLKDFAIQAGHSYTYYLYFFAQDGSLVGGISTSLPNRVFKAYSLLKTHYNDSDGCYHVDKEYLFSCNLTDEALSNNSNKSYVQNFTPYPTVFRSTANYASGTLQALIGFVDKKTYRYWDDTVLMKELSDLSTTDSTLFLRDLKGHLWMIDVGAVQQTVKYGTREMQVTISLPWTEIGDASDVSIIQTPDDEGWAFDAQVLDVKFDVNVETGLLQVVYPFPYNGTAFYLVGVTPQGVINTVQPLPNTASQPTDGQLKAAYNINSLSRLSKG